MMELLTSWKQASPLSPMESEMCQRYFSNIMHSSVYDEECWLSVHSDLSLKWLFGEVFFLAPPYNLPNKESGSPSGQGL
jgi:hypothetical protein